MPLLGIDLWFPFLPQTLALGKFLTWDPIWKVSFVPFLYIQTQESVSKDIKYTWKKF